MNLRGRVSRLEARVAARHSADPFRLGELTDDEQSFLMACLCQVMLDDQSTPPHDRAEAEATLARLGPLPSVDEARIAAFVDRLVRLDQDEDQPSGSG